MIQWPNEKKDKKTNNDPLNTTKNGGDELKCCWKVNSSCCSGGIRHLTLVNNLVISYKRGNVDGIATTTNGIYPWVTQDNPCHDFLLETLEVMTSTTIHGVQFISTCIIGEVFLFVLSRNSYDLRLKLVYTYT